MSQISLSQPTMDRDHDFCLCYGKHEEKACRIPRDSEDKLKPNMFVTLKELHEALDETHTLHEAKWDEKSENSKDKRMWKWEKKEGCELYYIFVYSGEGIRLAEHDVIAPQNKFEYDFKKIPGMQVLVLPLYKTNSAHGFVKVIQEVRGLKDYNLVVDLSVVKNENRKSKRLSPTHFGFLCSNDNTYSEVKRVAAKQKTITNAEQEKHKIELTLDAGGQYNAKYLACTKIEPSSNDIWIVMELCIKTLDVLIRAKIPEGAHLIDERKMKSCFRQVLQGLIHLHSKGIIHGDMKLTNVFLSLDGKYLKIGEYDHIGQDQSAKSLQAVDMGMTCKIFLQCFKRDSNYDPQPLIDEIRKIEKHEISDEWIQEWRNLAGSLNEDTDSFISAYFIMHMIVDKPKAEELLQHPIFWNEYKILDFIVRMDGCFYVTPEQKSENQKKNLCMEKIKNEFCENCNKLWLNLNWIESLEHLPPSRDDYEIAKKYILDEVTKKNNKKNYIDDHLIKIIGERWPEGDDKAKLESAIKNCWGDGKKKLDELEKFIEDVQEKENLWPQESELANAKIVWKKIINEEKEFNPSDITTFVRLIRNKYGHYHESITLKSESSEENVEYECLFKSSVDLWKFFSSILPEMFILLHRSVWLEKENERLPDDLQQFFSDPNIVDPLGLRKQDEEIPMNYYKIAID